MFASLTICTFRGIYSINGPGKDVDVRVTVALNVDGPSPERPGVGKTSLNGYLMRGLLEAGHRLLEIRGAAIALLSQRDPPLGDAAAPRRPAREIDDVDRIEGRRLLELVVDRRESGARNRGRAFYANDIGALAGRAGRARP